MLDAAAFQRIPLKGSVLATSAYWVELELASSELPRQATLRLEVDTGSFAPVMACSSGAMERSRPVPCGHPSCLSTLCSSTDPPSEACAFALAFADGAQVEGSVREGMLRLATRGGTRAAPAAVGEAPFRFGCASDGTRSDARVALIGAAAEDAGGSLDGVLGLARGPESLPSQLFDADPSAAGRVFGLCLAESDGSHGLAGGAMWLGSLDASHYGTLPSPASPLGRRGVGGPAAALRPGLKHLSVRLEALLVDDAPLDVAADAFNAQVHAVVDTGTADAFLPEQAVVALRAALIARAAADGVVWTLHDARPYPKFCALDAPGGGETTGDAGSPPDRAGLLLSRLPTLGLRLAGASPSAGPPASGAASAVRLDVVPCHYLRPTGVLGECLGVHSIGEGVRGAVLGARLLQGLSCTFDLDRSVATFSASLDAAVAVGEESGEIRNSVENCGVPRSARCALDARRPAVVAETLPGAPRSFFAGLGAGLGPGAETLAGLVLLAVLLLLAGAAGIRNVRGCPRFVRNVRAGAAAGLGRFSPGSGAARDSGGRPTRARSRRLYPRRLRRPSESRGRFTRLPTVDAADDPRGGAGPTSCRGKATPADDSERTKSRLGFPAARAAGSSGPGGGGGRGRAPEEAAGAEPEISNFELGVWSLDGDAGRRVFAFEAPGSRSPFGGDSDPLAAPSPRVFVPSWSEGSHPFALSPPRAPAQPPPRGRGPSSAVGGRRFSADAGDACDAL
jgi:hypothetical protein